MPTTPGSVDIRLFNCNGGVEQPSLEGVDLDRLDEDQLLWIDVDGTDVDGIRATLERLHLDANAVRALCDGSTSPIVSVHGEAFFVRVVAVRHAGNLTFNGSVLGILAGNNYVITRHAEPIAFLEELQEREREDAALGHLSADSFTASLLDWHLNSYFEAVSVFESADERLESAILDRRHRDCLDSLQGLRRAASRLRRMLAAHRPVFAALARPDFRPQAQDEVNRHLQMVDQHFERAMDAVEMTRDVVIGSFELFSNQTALRTNDIMRVLTMLTAIMGGLAVIAGVLGMNFKAPFFDTGLPGFLIAVGLMVTLAMGGMAFARWRKWL